MEEISRIVFFGTPEFALPSLDALVAAGRPPVLVVAQPDRPAGRGRSLATPPVAERAREHGLPLEQPARIRDGSFLERLRELEPELAVVVAYGRIFPAALLELPTHGCLNVHASLLPRWRGAAPVQAAIAAGDRETGVTVMRMVEELDAGPVLATRRLEIGAAETAPELAARLATAGAELLIETIANLETGEVEAREQEEALATYAPPLDRHDGRVDWTLPAPQLFDRWRAFQPWPGLFAEIEGESVKLLRVEARTGDPAAAPGTVLEVDEAVLVACGEGTALALLELQRPGRKALSAAEVARGLRLEAGHRIR